MPGYRQTLNPFSAYHSNRRAQGAFDKASAAYAADPTMANKEALSSAYGSVNETLGPLGTENAAVAAGTPWGAGATGGVNALNAAAQGDSHGTAVGAGQAAGAIAGTAVGGPIGGAIGSALGGAAGGALSGGPEEIVGPAQTAPAVPAQFVPIDGGQPQGGGNPFYADGTVGAMQIPGPMSSNPPSPDTFINGQIASQHFPSFMGGTHSVPGYNDGYSAADLGFSPQGMTVGQSPTGKIPQHIIGSSALETATIPLGVPAGIMRGFNAAAPWLAKAAVAPPAVVGGVIKSSFDDAAEMAARGIPKAKAGEKTLGDLRSDYVKGKMNAERAAGKRVTHNDTEKWRDEFNRSYGDAIDFRKLQNAEALSPNEIAQTTVGGAGWSTLPFWPLFAGEAAADSSNLTGSEGIRDNPGAAFSYMDGTHSVPGYMGGTHGVDTVGNLNHGTEGAMMEGPMGTPNFGYQPSGPTMQEMHADMAAAGKENREMMKMQNEERRKDEMHKMKMQEAKQMGAVKVANAQKGPMAR